MVTPMESRWLPDQPLIDELIRLVNSGTSTHAAAIHLGIPLTTAYRISREHNLSRRYRVTTTEQAEHILTLFRRNMPPTTIARHVGVGLSVVYRLGEKHGFWRPGVWTTKRCTYLMLRINAMNRRDAAAAVGIHPRTAADYDKGIVKIGDHRRPFVPSGGDAMLYKRLMQLLEYVDGRVSTPIEVIPQARIDTVINARYLSAAEREVIADLRNQGKGVRAIARMLGRSPGTISKELSRNRNDVGLYLPSHAHRKSVARRFRPKQRKIDAYPRLRQVIWDKLMLRWSPVQIAGWLRKTYPGQKTMWVCAETIYQSLFFQAKGKLKEDIASCLRQGRAVRRRRGVRVPRQRFVDPMVMISSRPAEADDRAVPGHWEGDLILGAGNKSAIATLVERSTRYVMLVHLPDGHSAADVRDGLVTTISQLPEHLRGSLTWDQGSEMAGHRSFSVATDCPVYFCDPASPWQRGSNENTNGLLRQYFPKGSDLSRFSAEDLEFVAQQLNGRPRQTLGFDTPAERMAALVGWGS